MPYKKRSGYKKKSSYGSYAKKFARGVGTTAKLVRDVNYLRSVINAEKKLNDVSIASASSTTAAFVLLNGLVQGDTVSTREGSSIKLSSLWLQLFSTIHASATSTVGRVMVFYDSQPNGATVTVASLLSATTSVVSPLVIGFGLRFKVLMDWQYCLSITGNQNAKKKRFIKIPLHTRYTVGTNNGDITDITTGALFLMHMSTEATNTPTLTAIARLRFYDN